MAFTKRDTAIILPCLFLLSLALVNAELLPPRELVGKTVILRSTMMQTVAISTKTDAWNDADIVVRVPSGTVAEVIGVSTVRLTHNEDLHWYQVKAMYQGKEYVGWVHETYVHEMASPKPIAPPVAVDVDEKQCAF